MSNVHRILACILIAFAVAGCATQPQLSSRQIDDLVDSAMQEFSVPGVAVGVIKDGVVVHAKGYGVAELGLDRIGDQ